MTVISVIPDNKKTIYCEGLQSYILQFFFPLLTRIVCCLAKAWQQSYTWQHEFIYEDVNLVDLIYFYFTSHFFPKSNKPKMSCFVTFGISEAEIVELHAF